MSCNLYNIQKLFNTYKCNFELRGFLSRYTISSILVPKILNKVEWELMKGEVFSLSLPLKTQNSFPFNLGVKRGKAICFQLKMCKIAFLSYIFIIRLTT